MPNPRSVVDPAAIDATDLLTSDHREVRQRFAAYDRLVERDADADERGTLARLICMMLAVHATIEEEIFYPEARRAIDEPDLLDEAEVEHASAKDLIAQIHSMSASDRLFDAKVKVLGEYVEHHVKEEEQELFPKLRRGGKVDLRALGERLRERQDSLLGKLIEID